jgi:hypothetical protein
MKHVKLATKLAPVKAQVFNPYQDKKNYILGPFCADGTFTK